MTKWIGAIILALPLIFAGSTAIRPAAAASPPAALQPPQARKATDLGARRRYRHRLFLADRAYPGPYPSYYDRPYYYAPAPFVPFNFGYPLLPPPWW
jgi:hypothetical protein